MNNDKIALSKRFLLFVNRMKKRQLTPQEKKLLSYRKDCRNLFAESRSRSRFAVARRRALSHQAFRHRQKQLMADWIKSFDGDFDILISAEKALRAKSWRKVADSPLGEFVSVLLRTRLIYGTNKSLKMSELIKKAERSAHQEWRTFRWSMT